MGDDSSLSRRERQLAARSDQILDAAAKLFAERGFHRTTTRDIAEAADVAEGTLYNYFANKDDLLLSMMHRLTESFNLGDNPDGAMPVNAREHFTSLLMLRSIFKPENTTMMQALLSEILANAELRERYYHQLLEPSILGLEKSLRLHESLGQVKPKDIPVTARVIAGVVIGMFFLEVLGDHLVKAETGQIEDAIIDLLFDGISANH